MTIRSGLVGWVALATLLVSCRPGFVGDAANSAAVACGGASFEEIELATMPTLDTLPADVLAAVDDGGNPVVDGALDWRVASADDDEVVLIRELEPGEPGSADDTHAVMRLGPIDGAPNLPDGTWFLWAAGPCSPRLADAARGQQGEQAEVRLAVAPAPDDTELLLLVMERECASGRSADGRISLDEVKVTDAEVRLRVSVRPAPGDQTCPSNPWTPYTIDLGRPVGERTVVDANLVPARPLEVGGDSMETDP